MKHQTRPYPDCPFRSSQSFAILLGFCLLLSQNAFGFNYPLHPEEIEEAYSLGRTSNHEDLANFVNQYEHDFQYPSDHPLAYVTSAEFQTPYEQIVLKSLRSSQYTKFKAAEDYQANAGAVFVRVIVALRMVLQAPVPAADSFQVIVSQADQIEPRKTTSTVLCDPYDVYEIYPTGGDCTIYTREILVRFDHDQFSSRKVTIKVLLPEGKSLETKFDPDKLK
jgi:hypothetical protein